MNRLAVYCGAATPADPRYVASAASALSTAAAGSG